MTKKNIKLLVSILCTFAIALLIELFIFNFDLLFLPNNEKGLHTIQFNQIEKQNLEMNNEIMTTTSSESTMTIPYEGYIGKIKILFASPEYLEFNMILNYNYKNMYKNDMEGTTTSLSTAKLNLSVENINKEVKDLKITIDKPNINILKIEINNTLNLNYLRILFIFVILLDFLLLYYFRNSVLAKLENKFLFLILTIGFLLICLVPNTTFYSLDDETHFKNSLSILQGKNVSYSITENELMIPVPFSIKIVTSKEEMRAENRYLNDNDHEKMFTYPNNSKITYNSLAYLPNGIILRVLDFLRCPFTLMFKIGKLINLLFYTFVCYFATKLAKRHKRIIFTLALLPSNVWLACQYSCDPPITACLLLSLSLIINNFVSEKKSIKWKNNIIMFLSFLYGVLIKAIYAPLLLIALLVPKEKFYNEKEKKKYRLTVITVFTILMASFVFPILFSPKDYGDYRVEGTSQVSQIETILKHPFGYVEVLKDNALEFFNYKILSGEAITRFGYLGDASSNTYYITLLLLIFVSITDTYERKKEDYTVKFKAFNLLLILTVIIFIWTALYIDFNVAGATTINGVQSRYFLPLLFPLILCINSNQIVNKIKKEHYDLGISYIILIIFIFMIFNLILKPICF